MTAFGAGLDEFVRQATGIAGDLPAKYAAHVADIRLSVEDLAAAHRAGTISDAEMQDAMNDILLRAKTLAAMAGIDAWSKRRDLAYGALAVVIKVATA